MRAEDSSFNSISDIHHQKEDLTLALGSVYAWTDWTSIRFSAYRDFLFLSGPDSAWATRKGNEIEQAEIPFWRWFRNTTQLLVVWLQELCHLQSFFPITS